MFGEKSSFFRKKSTPLKIALFILIEHLFFGIVSFLSLIEPQFPIENLNRQLNHAAHISFLSRFLNSINCGKFRQANSPKSCSALRSYARAASIWPVKSPRCICLPSKRIQACYLSVNLCNRHLCIWMSILDVFVCSADFEHLYKAADYFCGC